MVNFYLIIGTTTLKNLKVDFFILIKFKNASE